MYYCNINVLWRHVTNRGLGMDLAHFVRFIRVTRELVYVYDTRLAFLSHV